MSAAENGVAGDGKPVLRFFGLHTAAHALETLSWVAPYAGIFLFVLVMLSLLVQKFFPLPLWVHVLAIAIAGVNCFFFLARIRQSTLEDQDAGEGDDADRADPKEG